MARIPLAGQEALDKLLESWMPLWQRPDRDQEEDPREWQVDLEPLPPITEEQLMGVLKCYSPHCGLGCRCRANLSPS